MKSRKKAARKGAAKRAPAKKSKGGFAKGEHVRVVPLHQPKPKVEMGELGDRREPDDDELFSGKPHVVLGTPKLTYRGGALLTNVEVYTIFWGKKWGTKTGIALIGKLSGFFREILTSPLMDQLAEYSVKPKKIGHGSLTGTKTISAGAPAASITDSAVQKQLSAWIGAGTVPKPNANTLYFIYLDPGIVSIMGGSKSCQSFCGYHNNVGKTYYAVMPYPSCAGCLGGLAAFDALTGTSSHELCEAITDPVPGAGWYDDQNGEIGDICAWHFKKVSTYTVQLEWSNKAKACV